MNIVKPVKLILLFIVACHGEVSSQGKILDIDPVFQTTPEWCWVSCGEMVFKYYDVCCINPSGNYQCGIIALLSPQCNFDCYSCPIPAGSTQRIINMFAQYPRYAQSICGSSKGLISCTDIYGAISEDDIKSSIDEDMPILAGVNPSGFSIGNESQHATIIIGYEEHDNDLLLIVNDPFPYGTYPGQNPYIARGGRELQPGRYEIDYKIFRGQFAWNRTLNRLH